MEWIYRPKQYRPVHILDSEGDAPMVYFHQDAKHEILLQLKHLGAVFKDSSFAVEAQAASHR